MSSARAADRTQWIARARRRGRGRPEIARSSRGRVADTGPCYTKYNTVLRGCGALAPPKLKEDFVKLTRGNKYVTTLHVINSAVVKLSKLTRVEPVYRGIRSGKLPWGFTEANAYNVKGGVEPGFTSCSRDRQVAEAYARGGKGGGYLFECQQGMVDRGADLTWLSQCSPRTARRGLTRGARAMVLHRRGAHGVGSVRAGERPSRRERPRRLPSSVLRFC